MQQPQSAVNCHIKPSNCLLCHLRGSAVPLSWGSRGQGSVSTCVAYQFQVFTLPCTSPVSMRSHDSLSPPRGLIYRMHKGLMARSKLQDAVYMQGILVISIQFLFVLSSSQLHPVGLRCKKRGKPCLSPNAA